MYGHLQGFLGFLDILAEGGRRHVEQIDGRGISSGLQLLPVVSPARDKIPLTQDQISRLFETRPASKVPLEH
ncbi:MAG: hypothetical protein ACRER4_01905 [Steroidobacteraceae bacterium]